jgi:ATPase subunit of ABC transporter with duplicated ATPase domains
MWHLERILKRLETLALDNPEHIILDDYWLDDLCSSLVTQKQNSSQNQYPQLIVTGEFGIGKSSLIKMIQERTDFHRDDILERQSPLDIGLTKKQRENISFIAMGTRVMRYLLGSLNYWNINPESGVLFEEVRDLLNNKYIPCALVIPTNKDPYITLAPNLPKPYADS